ncbi:discoidin domain-containing protein [Paenibacillus sp. KQZ6P-2]|uniref:Discoidin domain-containing protein n=1 Tax=Paenibacillus mangrovi TaxID=2931978 RepID=A0A9X1WSF8_9BACL|nr:discoidin domain-containing protein [Paenibacillus mangrovi]MCJ8012665.1 discoidin domain-containing protein [Paenibacillus mangrovi]
MRKRYKMVKTWNKLTGIILSATMLGTSFIAYPGTKVNAQQSAGNAPFINSWLVSGPFDSPVVDKKYNCDVAELVNYAPLASEITASSSTLAVNPVSYLVDGSTRNQWVTENDSSPWVNLKWKDPIDLNEVKIAQWGDSRHVNNWYHLTFTLEDGSKVESGKVNSTSSNPSAPTVYSTTSVLKKVVEMKVEIDKGRTPYPSITGISEIEVYNKQAAEPTPDASAITPKLGDPLSFDSESHKWEYFDDRIYNRNYDDYQDLYGYFTVKKGIDTKNKYVYAHTYVYSPVEQQAYFNVGASGSYRLYVNDKCVTASSVPVEVQKDLTKQAIQLKQGWNKLMIQIKHTYTEDVNSNNVPIAADQNVAYLGFYGRVTDQNGNKINGLVQSVEGDTNALRIVSQGISTDDAINTPLPTNNMPLGYKEWPYVWNKSKGTKKYGVSASAFQFMASGGAPGYTWSVVDGKLPDGLELNADGTIADGLVNGNVDLNSSKGIISINAKPGDYHFTVQVKDRDGNTAEKNMTITVKERPNKWFEEGRVGALSHTIVTYGYFDDPNFSTDLWAERAKRQGHSLVSIEALQQNYYWPSKFADPNHDRQKYYPKDENGQVVDGLKQFEEAVKRYGIKFGLYYATEGGGLQHYSTDVFVQNVEDLILRYDPAYLYFDGPQAMPNANYDVMYSMVRNYSDDIIINSNAWGDEYGDPDLRTAEASHIYANAGANHLVKRTTMEPWKSLHTKSNYTPYYAKRDDYRQVAKEMIMNAGRGYVDNNDQMPLMSRGTNWDSPEDVATRYPKSIQEFIDVREGLASWFAPEGKPERHESTTGTMPYYLSGYGYEDDGKGNYEKFAFPNSTTGPQWGYATSRDNNIYLHIMKGPDGKNGFDAIAGKSLTIRPIKDHVTSVTWLNEDIPVTSFNQNGDSLTINLANVQEDPIDSIIKIVTDNSARKYTLTNINATGEQLSPSSLRINTEGYMTFPALKAKLSDLTYKSANPGIASVNESGIVTPVSNGTTSITVNGSYEGVTKEDTLKVTAKDGKIYVGESMIGATLLVNGKEAYGEFESLEKYNYQIEGRSSKGGPIGLDAAQIKWHGGIVDLKAGDKYKPVVINEVNTFIFKKDEIIPPYVEQPKRGVVWAEVTLDGKTFTTNKIYMDLLPYRNLAKSAEITASHGQDALDRLVDGKTIDGIHFDQSKWSVAANEKAWIQFKLPAKSEIANINLNFNSLDQNYLNTPKTLKIQTSDNGTEWKDVSTVNGPTGNAYFGFYNQYPLNTEAQYVKLIFDGGSNGTMIDLLEVAINGMDRSHMFDRFEFEYKPVDATTGKYEIKAFTAAGEPTNEDAEIIVTSENPDVITVDKSNLVTAVSEGMAKIRIKVIIGGRSIENVTYLFVDKAGKIYTASYLNKIKLTLRNTTIKPNQPIVATIDGLLSTGEQADISRATVEYEFSDERLSVVEGSNTIVVRGDIGVGFQATVTAKVTLDGITVVSSPVTISAVGNNIASSAIVTVSSVRDRNGAPNGDNQDDRYLGIKATDGNKSTSWAAKQADKTPWIKLQFPEPVEISKINLVDRGHEINQIVEGLLEWEGGSKKVTGIQWQGQPDNIVTFDTPITTSWIKFTIDPENKYNNPSGAECGLSEFEVFESKETAKTIVDYKSVAVVETNLGQIPTLPKQVEAVYNDGTTGLVDVVWDEITPDMVAKEGVFSVYGSVEGTTLKAKATYRVKVVDQEAPTTTDNAPEGWVNEDVTILLDATDSGTGVASTHYIVNDGTEQTGNSVVLSEEGIHTLVYWSVDKAGNVEERHTVTVKIDKTAPTLTIGLDKTSIWPANHNMVKVNATLDSSDTLSGIVSVVLTSITSNEPDSGQGDIQANFGSEDTTFSLRAERSGEGTGRIYTIAYTVTDKSGNQAVATATVTVPHDQSGK